MLMWVNQRHEESLSQRIRDKGLGESKILSWNGGSKVKQQYYGASMKICAKLN